MKVRIVSTMDLNMETDYNVKTINGETHIFLNSEIVVQTFEQRVKICTALCEKTLGEVADGVGMPLVLFLSRCKTGKMSFDEQRSIADAMGCKIVIKFVFEDGAEYTGNDIKELVTDACTHIDIPKSELANRLGLSRQNFCSRLAKGKFTDDMIDNIAAKIGCKYYNYFELQDGARI